MKRQRGARPKPGSPFCFACLPLNVVLFSSSFTQFGSSQLDLTKPWVLTRDFNLSPTSAPSPWRR